MYRALLPAVLSLTLVVFAVPEAYAQKPPPPPKEDTAECSPGFYKNHPETWVGICCNDTDNPTCSALQSDLEAKGPGSGAVREAAAEYLDACFGSSERTPCTDD